ncbi:MAG: hypothetical protein V4773_21250 [Verrucomicrobiota bacterium]
MIVDRDPETPSSAAPVAVQAGRRAWSPPRWAFALVALAAFAFLLRVYAGIYTPEHGITKFLRVGQEFDNRGTKVFRETPKFIDPYPAHRWGFDGQLYAEMALDPMLRDPHLHIALDNPPYRAQRILISWLAWIVGLGQPFWVLNAYAAMNLIFWVGFAWLAAKLFRPHGWAGLAGYAAILLTCGVIESMQASLTDLPSFTLMLWALMVGGTAGAGILAAATLVRSTSLIGFVGLAQYPPPWGAALRRNIKLGLIVIIPFALWALYVLYVFRGRQVNFDGGNLTMPFRGMMEKLGEFSVKAHHGPIRWHRLFFELYKSYDLHAVLTIIAVVTQSVYVVLHREWKNPLWRWGAVVAIYFSCISFLSWDSHFTITRHALPITLVFNLLLAMRPTKAWVIWFVLGNCFVPFGVRYFDGMREFRTPAPLPEFVINVSPAGTTAPVDAKSAVTFQYEKGWTAQQWWPDMTWRWALTSEPTIIVKNDSPQTVRATLGFVARSSVARTLEIKRGAETLWRQAIPAANLVVRIENLEIPPGEGRLIFLMDGPPGKSEDPVFDKVMLKMQDPQVWLQPAR